MIIVLLPLRMLDISVRWMSVLGESAAKLATNPLLTTLTANLAHVQSPARAVMAVNTLNLAVLAINARVQTSQERNGFDILLSSLVFVLKWAVILLGTWAAQIVVIAQLVVSSALFNLLKNGCLNNELVVQATWAWVPFHLWMRRNNDRSG